MAGESAQASKNAEKTSNATSGDHDRVAMLSLHADGVPAQLNPEVIIPEEEAQRVTRQQFVEQAVSAADVEARRGSGYAGFTVEDAPQDPYVEELQKAHEDAAKAGEKAADAAVKKLT
jgi:hypothetical protein